MTAIRGVCLPTLCVALLLAGGILGGCAKECEENLHCGIDEICSAGDCAPRGCGSSDDCPMETYCEDETGECNVGCQSDRDCFPYHRCDEAGLCINAGCRSTTLDCEMGEFCNPLTGECFTATGDYCKPCEHEDDCGTGNMCISIGGSGTYCGVDCALGQECPRGYECGAVQDVSGNILGYQCFTACWLLED